MHGQQRLETLSRSTAMDPFRVPVVCLCYLDKMEENVDFIIEHMNGVSREQLEQDPVLQDSMMLRLVQISENAKNLTEKYFDRSGSTTAEYGVPTRICSFAIRLHIFFIAAPEKAFDFFLFFVIVLQR